MRICVVGLGNIGYNLFQLLSEKFPGMVTGVDVNEELVTRLRQVGHDVVADYESLTDIDMWLMAVSTGKRGENLFGAFERMHIRPGSLISIESTLPPGTMVRVRDFMEEKGFTLGLDLFLIHVPHRVMFGVDQTVCDTPRVIGAFTEQCLARGRQFYAPLVPKLVEVEDVRIVEVSKVIENVKRYVDVAFAQEIYRYCQARDLDFESLRVAVNSKSNVALLGVDWGIGGECLPKDMDFLRLVFGSPLLEGAVSADAQYRQQLVDQVGKDQLVLVRGISYKTGVKDIKHSRGVDLVLALEAKGTTVWVEDPLFTPVELAALGFRPYVGAPACEGEFGSPVDLSPTKDAGLVEHGEDDEYRPQIVIDRGKALAPEFLPKTRRQKHG